MQVRVVTSHPIQYQAPLWKALASKFDSFETIFLTDHGIANTYDREFARTFSWDIDLLDGYKHQFLSRNGNYNLSKFSGIRLPKHFEMCQSGFRRIFWIEGWRYKAFVDLIAMCTRKRVPFVIRGESNLLGSQSHAKQLAKRIVLGYRLRRASAFLCIGSENRKFYRWLGFDDSKFLSAPYFVDNDRFAASAASLLQNRNKLREQWGIRPEAKVILFCGKLIRKKHPDHVLAAVAKLQSQHPNENYHILFVGDGELRDILRDNARIAYDGLENLRSIQFSDSSRSLPLASFAGFLNQSKIAEAYVAADLLVLPSDAGETWGLVVNEAMASGIPAVASNLAGSAPDLPAQLTSEAVYTFGDINELALAIWMVLGREFSRQDVRQVASTHHMERTVESFVAFVEKLQK